jgi:hypothetical protein
MTEGPVLHHYHMNDRAEVLDFIREAFPAHISSRVIAQWTWKYEASPLTPPEGSAIDFIRIGGKMVGLHAGFLLKMWMGGIDCIGEGRGEWVVHPDHRGQNLWRRVKVKPAIVPPVQFGWSRLPARVNAGVKWLSDPVRPLVRVLDAGPLVAHFTHSRRLAPIGTFASATARFASKPFRRIPGSRNNTVVRFDAFDGRIDSLWERARRPTSAMVVRDRRYLNWRYCERPDATYMKYGLERTSELDGFLVARLSTYQGMPWGYLVDFLVAENSSNALSSLIREAIDEFRRLGVAAVVCYATDAAARAALFRSGFFPAPQRKPIRFVRFLRAARADLARFSAMGAWYLTMGDGDLEMSP